MATMQEMRDTMPQTGVVCWLGIRVKAREPLTVVPTMEIDVANGVVGDHFSGKVGSKRQVTLIQQEHLDAIANILGKEIDAGMLRRNIVVGGINLLALKDQEFQIGSVVLRGTGNCHPCSRMEENLGSGGYNAVRGHGGLTATVVASGKLKIGDSVSLRVGQD